MSRFDPAAQRYWFDWGSPLRGCWSLARSCQKRLSNAANNQMPLNSLHGVESLCKGRPEISASCSVNTVKSRFKDGLTIVFHTIALINDIRDNSKKDQLPLNIVTASFRGVKWHWEGGWFTERTLVFSPHLSLSILEVHAREDDPRAGVHRHRHTAV